MKRLMIGTILLLIFATMTTLLWGYPSAELAVPKSDIIFSHKLHVGDNGVECLTCHKDAEASAKVQDSLLPTMEICGQCHDAVNDDKQCGMCHRNTENPEAPADHAWPIEFNHLKHIAQKFKCEQCHAAVEKSKMLSAENMPKMRLCLDCHDGNKAGSSCELCHGQRITLAEIHPADWRHQHGDKADIDREWCGQCHRQETYCIQCHRGDNLTGKIHDLNYKYNHGLDARSKEADCRKCHDTKSFCDGCHQSEGRYPMNHSTESWLADHGRAAEADPENCASCHDSGDPTCARGGCHDDFDGIKGNGHPIHLSGADLRTHGPWHDDSGYFCFQCHVSTHQPGNGFCGYCHGAFGD